MIILGPIIGEVTASTARILVEFQNAGTESIFLVDPLGNKIEGKRYVFARRPAIFKFKGLLPKTFYRVSANHKLPMSQSSFHTLNEYSAPINFAVCSCNSRKYMEKVNDDSNLWGDMARRALAQEIDCIFHIGDQIYADYVNDLYERSTQVLKKTQPKNWDIAAEEIREMIRNEYRLTWGSPKQSLAMANCPNLTMIDDHEIRDDWGWRSEDSDPLTVDGFYGLQSRWVYYEYQRQLWDDINFEDLSDKKTEFHIHILNNVGIFFFDYRGKNSWNKIEGEKSQLGGAQWAALKNALKSGGTFDKCQFVMIVSTLPVVLFTKEWNKVIPQIIDDYCEQWQYAFSDEQSELLSLMTEWKNSGYGKREIMLVGGDIHHAGHTDILKNGKKVFGQIVTSGICQIIPKKWEFLISTKAMSLYNDLGGGWSFKHHDWTEKNNYALISLKETSPPFYTAGIIASRPNSSIEAQNLVTNKDF